MLKLFIFCASVLFLIEDALTEYCKADDKYSWSYHGKNNGPENWVKKYPKCGKKYQSPIDIKEKDTLTFNLSILKYNNFNKPITKAKVQNIGWTVIVIPEDGIKRYITILNQEIILEEIHFHFGSKSDPGAEHAIDGTTYEMEVHYVTQHGKDSNLLVVLASILEVTDDKNSAFDPIVEVLSEVKYRNDSTNLKSSLDLSHLLPKDSESYYYYDGSNTIPPCEPGLKWLILKEIGKVGKKQLDTFMKLYSVGKNEASHSCLMGPNKRPLQNLDNRIILSSKETGKS